MKKLKKTLCLFLALLMCLGMVNIGALAATFDDLQNAIDGVVAETESAAPETPAEPSAGGDAGSSEDVGTPPVDPAPQSTANGTRFDHTNEDGTTSNRYGYGWNEGNNWWGIEAWDDENGRNVQLNEDVEGDSDPEGSPNPSGITVGKEDGKVTIDLNGNDIDGSDRYKDANGDPVSTAPQDATINVEDGGDLTLKNSAEEEGKVIGSDGHNVVTVKGEDSELTLEDGVNITHDAGNKLENMPEANPVVPADPDPAGPADPAPAANDDDEADTPETPEAKKPTFSTGKTDENGKTTTTTGRGVEVDGGKLTMNGGKITDNNVGGGIDETPDDHSGGGNAYKNNDKNQIIRDENGNPVKQEVGVYNGKDGGGVWVHNGGTFEMNDGEISNNAAAEGGGVFVGQDTADDAKNDSSSFQMNGGKVDGNVAKSGEGGGIYIHSTGKNSEDGNIITGGDITGNATFTTKDLGGGGIYVESQGGKLNIQNLVLTGNVANGLGGGLAGCVHGQTMINIENGSIIYGNTALGQAVTQGHYSPWGSAYKSPDGKNGWIIDGHTTQDGQTVWNGADLKDDAKDVFSAGKGTEGGGIYIPTEMLNGVKPGWTGFVYDAAGNKTPIALDENGQVVVTGSNVMGLTSHLTADDLKLVQNFLDKVGSQSRVLVSGNYSNVHGGGIGNNGELTIGTKSDEVKGTGVVVEIPTHKNVGYKDQTNDLGTFGYVDEDDKFTMQGGEFTFELVDSNGDVVFENTNNKDGNVAIRIPSNLINGAGEYTFTLREKKGADGKIEYDGTEYQIVVKVTEAADTSVGTDGEFKIGDNKIKVWKLNATTTVKTKDENGEWVDAGNSKENPAEFTNTYTQNTFAEVFVEKKWDDNDNPDRPTSVTVELYKNGDPTGTIVTLDESNGWKFHWTGLDLEENGQKIEWSVKEVNVDDRYEASDVQVGKNVTVTNKLKPNDPPPTPTPDPDPDPTPTPDPEPDIPDPDVPTTEPDPEPEEPVDIPDEQPPLTDIPDEEPPLVDMPDEEPPLTDIPEEEPPLTELPDEPVPLVPAEPEVELPEEPVPLANVPQTGDISLVWYAVAAMSAMGLAVLTLKKREDEED